ncbi:glycerophosphoryl diester phosphodiesterase [Tumebacillus sp. BK434]|uniref:glycerophosphodiester phosphodiesterase n=1 Tax=Tumebacillus sp. BK434 TaxID=2512169 RepID=UPI001049F534|nr:glycerophosphodiester phosphodiesterase family protein [Tumebacillus sp. BK434]TCP58860.1 glycerophosphoryl diester phosphodiesterase [Tumebacillus sp. BK434]
MKRLTTTLPALLVTVLLTLFTAEASAVSLAIPDAGQLVVPAQLPLIAHRGAAMLAPENTIPAFDAAVALQAESLELDVQMSRDGVLVVLHDSTVDRTTNGKGAVKELTFAELRALDAGVKFDQTFRGTKVPTLDEVLTRYGRSTGLLLELKVPSRYPGIEEKLAALLRQHQLDTADSNVVVHSFDSRSLQQFHLHAPDVPVGVLIKRSDKLNEAQLRRYAAFADSIHPNLKLVTPSLVEQVHELGMKIIPWTAQSPEDIQVLAAAGVDAVITDTFTR